MLLEPLLKVILKINLKMEIKIRMVTIKSMKEAKNL